MPSPSLGESGTIQEIPPDVAGGRTPHLPALTGLRFFAALLVVMVHYGTNVMPGDMLTRLARAGAVGVPFFFVLSGFILAYNYGDLRVRRMRCSVAQFWLARFARIYPIYLVGIALGIGPGLWIAAELHRNIQIGLMLLVNAALLESWIPSWIGVIDGPAWSLSAETFFYALFPFVLPWFLRRRTSELTIVIIMSWICSLGIGVAYLRVLPRTHEWSQLVLYNPLACLPEFLLGMATGIRFLRRGRPASRWAGPVSLGAAAVVLMTLDLLADLPAEVLFGGLLAPVFGLLIYTMAWGRGPLAALLSSPPLLLLGEASYALYLLHTSVWHLLLRATCQSPLTPDPSFGAFALYVAVCVILSIGLYRWVEAPMRKAIQNAGLVFVASKRFGEAASPSSVS